MVMEIAKPSGSDESGPGAEGLCLVLKGGAQHLCLLTRWIQIQ